jgi:PelA/Pel-15E family pectate lyase
MPRGLVLSVFLLSSAGTAPARGPAPYLAKPDAWFASAEAKQVAANILSQQSDLGAWPKNKDTTLPNTGDRTKLHGTFDNRATTDELRFLARMVAATKDDACRAAFDKGLDLILKAQYPTGGWPQYHPPGRQYHRHITFNDDTMVRLLRFLRDVATADLYAFVPADRRAAAKTAFDRGIACILKCQIVVDGKPTGWCAQHDEIDLRPRPARTFELASLSGSESVGIVRLLMSLDDPSPEVVRAVDGAAAWFSAAKLTGIRETTVPVPGTPKGRDKVVDADPSAPPLWARFSEIGTNKPVFADRDGVAKPTLADIGYERRNGYSWYGSWPQALLEKEYPEWKRRLTGRK